MTQPIAAFLVALFLALPAWAQCGGSWSAFLAGVKADATARGVPAATADRFLAGARQDPKVIRADRAQGVFKLTFTDFARRVISQDRMTRGRRNAKKHGATLARVRDTYGVDPSVMLAFWALETDYGAFQGNFNTRNALLTLSHDCRRPELFRPQVLAAMELYTRGDFALNTTGAWAGEIGMVQMLPGDILTKGVDGDGDGQVSLKTSAPDALMSGGKVVASHGWRAGEPWLVEVSVPADLDWSQTGLRTTRPVADWAALGVRARGVDMPDATLDASLLLPQGRKGPAFLALPNFRVYFEWNQSFVYVTTAAYFATRLGGAPVFDAGNPDPALSDGQMKSLQTKLRARGYDVGKIDGILGARTRAAVQAEQIRLGLPADAWPTVELLSRL
ncbi:MAG: lytic murein transglycosylase [Pseudomonadota bacterium]